MSNSKQVASWRNELARTAMLGLLQSGNINHRNASNVAEVAYQIADAMMKQAHPLPVPDGKSMRGGSEIRRLTMVINPYDTCKNCGERLVGDGYSDPMRCPDAAEVDWFFSAPDEGSFYCETGTTNEPGAATQQQRTHWCFDNPGLADQYRAEALAARKSLGFSVDANDVSPSDITNSIRRTFDHRSNVARGVNELVEALGEIDAWVSRWCADDHPVARAARKALASYRKQGDES